MENNFQIASAAVSDIGLNEKRPQNEDSYLDLGQKGVFAVADGVGGAQAGEVASQMAMEILSEAFVNFRDGGDAEELMQRAIEQANTSIFQMSHDLPQLSSMATTVVALHIDGNIATIGHVGDSRMYRLDGNGSLFRETQDHSIVEEEVRAGRMTAEQAATHPSRNVISRALGAERSVEVDMKTIMFEPETAFLLCSDGITRHINDFEIRELLALDTGPADICDRMKRICYERGAEDNLTAVIIKVSNEPARQISESQADVFMDFDEPTVATARPESTTTAEADSDEMETRPLEMPANVATAEYEQYADDFLMEPESEMVAVEDSSPALEPITEKAAVTAAPSPASDNYSMFGSTGTEVVEKPKASGGVVGRILSGIIMLLLGAIAGAAAYSYLMPKPTQETAPPNITPAPVAFKIFEESRRTVDADPAKFIATTSVTPQDAEDYYLLGRAYLLTGDYVKARAAYVEAKKRFNEVDDPNRRPVLNEIAMGIDNTFTQKALADELSKNALILGSNTNSNVNSNTANANR